MVVKMRKALVAVLLAGIPFAACAAACAESADAPPRAAEGGPATDETRTSAALAAARERQAKRAELSSRLDAAKRGGADDEATRSAAQRIAQEWEATWDALPEPDEGRPPARVSRPAGPRLRSLNEIERYRAAFRSAGDGEAPTLEAAKRTGAFR